jgi:MoxR-like ATPase
MSNATIEKESVVMANVSKNNSPKIDKELICDKFVALEKQLNEAVLERENLVHGAILALISGTNIVQLGVPGTAKSYITNKLSEAIQGSYFHYLLTKNTVPDEIFGTIDLGILEREARYVRNTTNTMVDAHLIFADEIFKGSSAVRNSLLTLANEHLFNNGNGMVKTPLVSMFAASNEGPENEGDHAIWDRFLQRFNVNVLEGATTFKNLLGRKIRKEITVKISIAEILVAQEEMENVEISEQIIDQILMLKGELAKLGISLGDRRWFQSVNLLKANAWLEGRTEVTADDFDVLKNVLWENYERDYQRISQMIVKMVDPDVALAKEFYEQICEMLNKPINSRHQASPIFADVRNIFVEIDKLFQKSGGVTVEANGEKTRQGGNAKIRQMCESVTLKQKEILAKIATMTT